MADPPIKTPAVPAPSGLRIRVRSRGGRPIEGATVRLEAGATMKEAKTDATGFVKFTLSKAELDAADPPGKVVVRTKKHHHGPDPGPGGKLAPGELSSTVQATSSGFDPSTPGLAKDAKGTLLEHILMDGGMRFGATASGVTRRLTEDEVQQELIAHHVSGEITLDAQSEFQFDHDPNAGEFDVCDASKCKIKMPKIDRRVGLTTNTIAKVSFFYLLNFFPSPANAKSDKIPGHRFLRDKFQWGTMPLRLLDQRHVVGLVRMCKSLNSKHGVAAIYTQGVSGDTTRHDCHGYGLALDFGGLSTEVPDASTKTMPVRLGTDFIVFLHWGNLPMWDPTTVASDPGNSGTWSRLKPSNDDGTDYTKDPTGATKRLHYRLDPAPFQDAVPTLSDASLAAELAKVAPHFQNARTLFQAVYDFAVAEYSDGNSGLGPGAAGTPTPIDSHAGHFILHPDYPKPNAPGAKNGRQAHINHLHFQLGTTNYPSARTT